MGRKKTPNIEEMPPLPREAVQKKKPPRGYYIRTLAYALLKHNLAMHLDPFPFDYLVYQSLDKERFILKVVENQQVIPMTDNAVMNEIERYTVGLPIEVADAYNMTQDNLKEVIRKFKSMSDIIEEPKAVRFADEPGLCFQRLPWPKRSGPTPKFDELIGRMSDPEAVRCFIASIFLTDSYNQQYLWIKGEGGDGKGCLIRFLMRCLGEASCSLQVPNAQDRFWTAQIVNKRLGVFTECKNGGYVQDDGFKALTGGDKIKVERKRKDAYSYQHGCKFMFTANNLPKIGDNSADKRRLIFAEIVPPKQKFTPLQEASYETSLWSEGGKFLSKCLEEYENKYPLHGPITTRDDALEQVIDASQELFESVLDTVFIMGANKRIKVTKFRHLLSQSLPRYQVDDFYRFLHTKGIRKVKEKDAEGKRTNYFKGISARYLTEK